MQILLQLTMCFICVMRKVDSAQTELDCGTTLFTNTSGVINLPKNSAIYPATVNCTYTISTTGLSHIWLYAYYYTFNKFLHFFQECDGVGLGVTIGCLGEGETELNPNTTMVFCRNRQMPFSMDRRLVFIDCRALKLSIRSISFDYGETLSLGFNVFEPDEVCGTTSFSAPYGIVSSPRLPTSYPKAVSCLYVIESDHVNSVVLKVDRLDFVSRYDRNAPCNDSWLMITCLVNGTSMAHSLADRKLCSIESPVVVRIPACRSVLFNFSIGYTNHEGTGFTVRYATGDYDPECGNTSFSGPTGVIASSPPSQTFRRHNLNCLYSITGGQNATISLTFISFRFSGRSLAHANYNDHCFSDWLTVSCLSDRSGVANISSSRRYCGSKRTPLKFSFPNCEVAVLTYDSQSRLPSAEFNAIYTVTETDGNIPTDELTTSTAATSVSTAIPVTTNCEVGCEINKDGTSCDCLTTQSGEKAVELLCSRPMMCLLPAMEVVFNGLMETHSSMIEKNISKANEALITKLFETHNEKIKELERDNRQLRERLDETETIVRQDDLIIYGLVVSKEEGSQHVSSLTTQQGASTSIEQPTLSDVVASVLNLFNTKLGLAIKETDISFAHRIYGKSNEKRRPILVRFVSRRTRNAVYEARKKLKDQTSGPPIFIDEHLSKSNSELLAKTRQLVKTKVLHSTWTKEGLVFVRFSDSLSEKPTRITSVKNLESLTAVKETF